MIPGGFPGFPGGGFPGGGSVAPTASWCAFPRVVRAEVFGQTDCNGCHSVSADGSLLLAQSVLNGAYGYELVANGPTPAPKMAGGSATWAAVYPDGSAVLDHVHGHRRGALQHLRRSGRRFGQRDGDRCDDGPADPEHGHSTRRAHALLRSGRDVPRIQRLRRRRRRAALR